MKVLITRKISPIAKELLEQHFEVEESEKTLTKEDLIVAVKSYDGILTMIYDQMQRDVLEKSEQVKVLSNLGVGLDNIDVEYAKKCGVAVYNTPDIVTQSTADLAFALLLSLMRKVPQASAYVKTGLWKQNNLNLFIGEEFEGKTFGIIGYGRIGQAVAKRALGFGPKIIAYNRSPIKETFGGAVEQVDWDTILQESDYLCLLVPLTKDTRGMINIDVFRKMRKKPLFINVARGPIICTDDLAKALKEGLIRGAALDVTDPEPLPPTHPLIQLPNCLIVPHIGTATAECRENMAAIAAKNLIHGLSFKPKCPPIF